MQNGGVASTFPHARRAQPGYDPDEVDDFLADARRAYLGEESARRITASSILRIAFSMRKGGYAASYVDAALARLEDAFATRERERMVGANGDQAWYGNARRVAQEILDRLVRPRGHRFRRVGPFAVGYHPEDVDPFVDQIADFLQTGAPISADEIRESSFRPRRGGYSEAQVDALLDTAVAVVLAVR